MTTNPKAKRTHAAAADAVDAVDTVDTVDAATEDETATAAATPAVSPREAHELEGLEGLDVFSSGDGPRADAVAADTADGEADALDATRPRAAAVLLDADAARHLATNHDISTPARQLPSAGAQPSDAQDAHEDRGGEGYTGYADENEDEDEGDETVIAQATPRPRTLSAAFRPPREEAPAREEDALPPDATLPPFPVPVPFPREPLEAAGDAIEDDLDPEEQWAIADQPTIYMPPRRGAGGVRSAAEHEGWPYRPQSGPGEGAAPGRPPAPSSLRPGIARPGVGGPMRRFAPIPAPRSGYDGPRLASPKGRQMPGTPPDGVSLAALADPRMERFQQLRETREAHEHGERAADEMQPVSEIVRHWWGDLLPGLRGALRHQHEAQASGVHPVSPYDAAPASRLGDAFGRLTQSARDLTGRARPALRRIHDQAEHAAQAIVGRFEQPTAVQQAPFLGPGRVAVFFKQGVTVGQAHALLLRRQARPMRLIPRKHGFLAAVAPGREAEICDGLREHPYIRDVAYIAYDDAGQPIDQQEA